MSGVETIARARRRWPGLRVLYMTGYADAGGAQPDTGGEKLLKKPFRLHELQSAVRDALERRPDRNRRNGRRVRALRTRMQGRGVPAECIESRRFG